jgi:hypothetical protein
LRHFGDAVSHMEFRKFTRRYRSADANGRGRSANFLERDSHSLAVHHHFHADALVVYNAEKRAMTVKEYVLRRLDQGKTDLTVLARQTRIQFPSWRISFNYLRSIRNEWLKASASLHTMKAES